MGNRKTVEYNPTSLFSLRDKHTFFFIIYLMDHLQFTIDLAIRCGELLKHYFDSNNFTSHHKDDQSVVTDADLAADEFIKNEILAQSPEDGIISEELNTTLAKPSTNIWVIDPLDGTTNFSLGLYYWGISIACLVDGYPSFSVMHFPIINETYTVQKNHGAFLNCKAINVEPLNPTRPESFFSCCSRTHRLFKVTIPFKPRILGSAAYSFCTVAHGISLMAFEATAKIWDIAGVWLLVKEAGGLIEAFSNDKPFPLKTGVDFSKQNYAILAAASPDLLAMAYQRIIPKTHE